MSLQLEDLGHTVGLDTMPVYDLPERYIIDINGQVYVLSRKHKGYVAMKPFVTKDGYVEYVLTDTLGVKRHLQGHRLCLIAFEGLSPDEKKIHANHKDGVRDNNNIDNLEWNTVSENAIHSYTVLGKKPWNKGKKKNK